MQQALLKLIEGTTANIPPQGGRKHPQQEYIQVDTTDILFICGGAFVGLEDVIGQRTGKKVVGFGANPEHSARKQIGELLALNEPQDMIKFGLIPEFVGSMPLVATLEELTREDLVRILSEPRNALVKQYQKLFSLDNVRLVFTESAQEAVAEKAIKRKAGARGLRSILEEIMLDIMFEIPSDKTIAECVISDDVVARGEKPVIIYEKRSA